MAAGADSHAPKNRQKQWSGGPKTDGQEDRPENNGHEDRKAMVKWTGMQCLYNAHVVGIQGGVRQPELVTMAKNPGESKWSRGPGE